MKRMIILAASILLVASANAASAASHTTGHHGSRSFVQRNVALQSQPVYHANADLKYGPQPDYPQSPPGGGY